MPEGVNAKVEVLFAQSLSAFAVAHLRITSLQGEISHLEKGIHRSSDPRVCFEVVDQEFFLCLGFCFGVSY